LLKSHLLLKSHGADIAQLRMPADGVVVHFNKFKYFGSGIFKLFKNAALQHFGFKAGEIRFHEGVVVGVVFASHALPDFATGKQFTKLVACILPAAVRMNDKALAYMAAG